MADTATATSEEQRWQHKCEQLAAQQKAMNTVPVSKEQQEFRHLIALDQERRVNLDPAAKQRLQAQEDQARRSARQRQMENIQVLQQQQPPEWTDPKIWRQMTRVTGNNKCAQHLDLPVLEPKDLGEIGDEKTHPESLETFKTACQNGPLSTVQAIVTAAARTPTYLHHGLCAAICANNIEVVRYLLSAGAPVSENTPEFTLQATPSDHHLPLFELFHQHGWTPATPTGTLLLSHAVTNLPLLHWLLAHNADPNLAAGQPVYRIDGPAANACASLKAAARGGHLDAARMLLDAGAEIRHGVPLHAAAFACPPGQNPHVGRIRPSKEFDEQDSGDGAARGTRRGCQFEGPESVCHCAVCGCGGGMAGAVERVRWLLERGADPEVRGPWGSAVSCANLFPGSNEMKAVVAEGVLARRWASKADET